MAKIICENWNRQWKKFDMEFQATIYLGGHLLNVANSLALALWLEEYVITNNWDTNGKKFDRSSPLFGNMGWGYEEGEHKEVLIWYITDETL